MKEIAYFMLPLGAVSAALLSVPCQTLQRSCIGICNLRVSLGRYFSLRLSTAFLLYNLFRFIFVCTKLMGGMSSAYARVVSVFPFLSSFRLFRQSPAATAAGSAASAAALLAGGGNDSQRIIAPTPGYFPVQAEVQNQLYALYDVRVQARMLRYQRDFWITLFAAVIWLFVCWASFLIRSYWKVLEKAHSSYESALQERRRVESVAAAKAATRAAGIAVAAAASSSVSEEEVSPSRDEKAAVVATATAATRETPAEEVEGVEVPRKTERKKMEVELTRMAAEEVKEEEEESAEAAEREKEETTLTPTPATTRRRKVPADGSDTDVCRGDSHKHVVVD